MLSVYYEDLSNLHIYVAITSLYSQDRGVTMSCALEYNYQFSSSITGSSLIFMEMVEWLCLSNWHLWNLMFYHISLFILISYSHNQRKICQVYTFHRRLSPNLSVYPNQFFSLQHHFSIILHPRVPWNMQQISLQIFDNYHKKIK